MLTVHHLGVSQSERIVWLCEELGIPYELKLYKRGPDRMAPPEYKALHPIGAAPVITDGDVVLAESGAVMEYVIQVHGGGRLAIAPGQPGYADYLYWLHFANGTFQPALMRTTVVRRAQLPEDNPVRGFAEARLKLAYSALEAHLAAVPYLAGDSFTAADIMLMFSLTTMGHFVPLSLEPYSALRGYVGRLAARPAYRAAMAKGDPDLPLPK